MNGTVTRYTQAGWLMYTQLPRAHTETPEPPGLPCEQDQGWEARALKTLRTRALHKAHATHHLSDPGFINPQTRTKSEAALA